MNALFDLLAVPFGYVMQFCYWITGGHYVIALFVFSFIIEVFMLPFAIKQQKSSIKAASLKPKEMAIRKKYAGREDQPTLQKMNQEIMDMQQKEGYNPFGGCLPLLIQFPLVMVLYNIVTNPMKFILNFSNDSINAIAEVIKNSGITEEAAKLLDQNVSNNKTISLINYIKDLGIEAFSSVEGFSDKISSLDDLPNMTLFGINLADQPSFNGKNWVLLFIPVITFVVYFLTMKLSRKFSYQPSTSNDDRQMACSTKIMDYSMPIMSASFTFMVPAAIGIYWIFRSIVSTLKQFVVSKLMPLPVFTEEDYKAAEAEFKAKNKSSKSKKERDPNKPKVRSLHHIDDDDYDYTPPESEKASKDVKTEVAGIKIEQAPAKKDDKNDK